MNKALSITLVAGGSLFIMNSVNVSHSFFSEVSRIFTGSHTGNALWFLTGGLTAVIVGIAGMFSRSKT